jgi:hypothetical protein
MSKFLRKKSIKQRFFSTLFPPASFVAACGGVAGFMILGGIGPAEALNLYDGSDAGNNLEINLETTVEYSTFYRVNDPSAILESGVTNPNGNDGDSNFRNGFFGNEVEALPVFDLKDGDYGMHVSGEFYINAPYLGTNKNNQPSTVNPYTISKPTDFTSATRNVNGEDARLLDAFADARHEFDGGQVLSLKVGRQTLLWGQSLFFANDGIAGGQAPVDLILAQSLPNPQAQQVFLPVGQAVLTYQPGNGLTLQGYYQFEYQHYNFQGVGSYFSSSDIFDKGGQRLILGPDTYLFRGNDQAPPNNNGQFGISAQDEFGNWDLGLYALRFDAKLPELYATLGAPAFTPNGVSLGTYRAVYPRDIQLFGASFSTTIGPANVAGEVSGRRNMPLDSGIIFTSAANPGNGSSDALYAIGDTLDAQLSTIYISPGIPLDPGGVSFLGEVEFNHLIGVTENRSALAPGRQGSAAAIECVVSPTYNDVLPALQITFPIGLTYYALGNSEMDATMNHGSGTFSVGVNAVYKVNWIAGLTYQDYLGAPILNSQGDAALSDRGYVSLNISHTF